MNRILSAWCLFAIFPFLLCCNSCQHQIPTVVEEIRQVRDSLIDQGIVVVQYFPPECDSICQRMEKYDGESDEYIVLMNSLDSILRANIYYDERIEEFDYRKDSQGNSFSRERLSSDMDLDQEKGYLLDMSYWYEEDESDTEEKSYSNFIKKLYSMIVDYNQTPKISNVYDYFCGVPTYMLLPKYEDDGVHSEAVDSVDRPYFDSILLKMQDYIDNKTLRFPVEIIYYWSSNEGFISANYAHTGVIPNCFFSYIFQYRLIQQIARFCPNIQLITDCYTEDEMLGLCKDFWYHDFENFYVLLKQDDGSYCVDIVESIYQGVITSVTNEGKNFHGITSGSDTLYYFYDGETWHKNVYPTE